MGLFDDLVGKAAGAAGGSGSQGLVKTALEFLANRQGGIPGLAEAFGRNGLGNIVSSWIGTGANLPVSAEQVQQVFGNEQIREFAQKAGVPAETAGSQLAQLLPGIVDRLTPGGQVPQGDLMSTGLSLLRGFMSGGGPER